MDVVTDALMLRRSVALPQCCCCPCTLVVLHRDAVSVIPTVKSILVTNQDKKITSFQPAWLIRCSTPH